MPKPTPDDVLTFWFGELDEGGRAPEEKSKRWWLKSDAFDAECTERFGAVHTAIVDGQLDGWLESPRGRLAYVIVLDQLSRNMFRDDPKMYAADDLALKAALEGIDAGLDRGLAYHERYFLYMPLMHAEDRAVQARCVELFAGLGEDFPDHAEAVAQAKDFAVRHQVIVDRFGRFPHRNAILGRESTPEELAFLQEPNSSF